MTNKKYMTVVFEYEDGAVFPLDMAEAFSSLDRKIADKTYVSAIGMEDAYSILETYEEDEEIARFRS